MSIKLLSALVKKSKQDEICKSCGGKIKEGDIIYFASVDEKDEIYHQVCYDKIEDDYYNDNLNNGIVDK